MIKSSSYFLFSFANKFNVYTTSLRICMGYFDLIRIVTYASQAEATKAVDILGSAMLGDRPLRAKIYLPDAGTRGGATKKISPKPTF